MTILEANKLRRDFHKRTNPTEEDRFLYTEALNYLIEETKDTDYMVELGAMYYEQRRFELALKYYDELAELTTDIANDVLNTLHDYVDEPEQIEEKFDNLTDAAMGMMARLNGIIERYI